MIFPARYWRAGLSVILVAAGCARTPNSYPIPEQHRPFKPALIRPDFITGADIRSAEFVVRDIQIADSGDWRWTGAEPELRFTLDSTHNRKLIYEYVVNETTFKDTGPVQLSFLVNGHLAGRQVCEKPGDGVFEKAIPAEWLHPGPENRVTVRVANPWRSPDGIIFGILLKRAGLVE